MAMEPKIQTKIDFHTHCLPAMDDGARDIETSVQMLRLLKAQGIETVLLTPHYCALSETVDSFLARRAAAFERLRDVAGLPRLLLGTEVCLMRELNTETLASLCLGESDCLLLELPFLPFASWMIEKVEEMIFHGGCRVIFAHLPRYLPYASAEDFDSLLSLPRVIAQVNTDDLLYRPSRRLAMKWIRHGVPVVFGSDCHNMDSRRPNFDKAAAHIGRQVNGICPAEAANELAKEIGLL